MARVKVGNVLFNILAIVTAIAVAFVLFTVVTGTKGYAVTSNSMADRLVKGDAVFSKAVSFDELREGDIVTVRVGDKGYFTHRIVAIDSERRTITTKGDANDSNDPMETEESRIAGRMWFSVPYIGYVSILTSGTTNITLLIALVIIAAALIAVNTAISKIRETRGDKNE